MSEIADAKKRGWPITAQEIIQERVEFEDKILRRGERVEHDPEVMRVELPSQKWSPTAKHTFGQNIIRFGYSFLP